MPATQNAVTQAQHYFTLGDFSMAEQYSLFALSNSPNNAEALQLLGQIAARQDELDRAIDYFNRSLICDGSNSLTWQHLTEAHTNLGVAFKAKGRLNEAAESFRNAVRLQPDSPEILYHFATTLHQLGDFDLAEQCYRQVIALKPNHADALNNLGTLRKELGDLDEAQRHFYEALRVKPDHAMAFYNLSELSVPGGFAFDQDDFARVEKLSSGQTRSRLDQSLLSFAAAGYLDRHGRYDEAFVHYQRANDLRRELDHERGRAFDAGRHEAFIERIVALHHRDRFEHVKGWGLESEVPVFIVGMPRTGSTLVEQILASHPRVIGAGELGELPWLIDNLPGHGAADKQLYASPLIENPEAAQEAGAGVLERLTRLGRGAARVVNKTLDNYLHLGVIATLFPRARVIHCRRDTLDTCLSCYFQNFFDVVFTWALEDIGVCFRSCERLMNHWSKELPLRIHELRYEELVQDQEKVTRDLLTFCDLEWDDHCLRFYETRRAVRTASSSQVRRPLSARTIGRWKNYRAHLDPLFQALRCSPPND